jgi:hypothetical protein
MRTILLEFKGKNKFLFHLCCNECKDNWILPLEIYNFLHFVFNHVMLLWTSCNYLENKLVMGFLDTCFRQKSLGKHVGEHPLCCEAGETGSHRQGGGGEHPLCCELERQGVIDEVEGQGHSPEGKQGSCVCTVARHTCSSCPAKHRRKK